VKKILTLVLTVCILFSLAACGQSQNVTPSTTPTPSSEPSQTNNGPEPSEAPAEIDLSKIPNQQLTIGTASAGGAFYVVGTGIAEVVTKYVEPLNVTAEITGGSVQNPILVGTGEADLGISNSDHALNAVLGVNQYDRKYDLAAIGSLHSSILHIVTLEKTGIKSITDLKGKKVAVGPAGGGSIPMFEAILDVYGMTLNDIVPSYLSYDDGVSQLKDGQVDCALAAAGYPASSVLSLSATDKVVMVSITEDDVKKISEKNPYYSLERVSKDVYSTDDDVLALCVRNLLYCSPELSLETVYAITKAVFGNLEELKTYHNALKPVTLDSVTDTSTVPMHPGAEMYFKEAGLIK